MILQKARLIRAARTTMLAAMSCFFMQACLHGEKLTDRAEYQAGLRALADGLPQVAALKFERMLKDGNLSARQSSAVSGHLVDALVRSKQPERAMVALTLFEVPDALFWKSQALFLQGKLRESEVALRDYLAVPSPPALEEYARLALGQVLIAEGRENTGRKEIREVMESRDAVLARTAQLQVAESETLSGRSEIAARRMDKMDLQDVDAAFVKGAALTEQGNLREAERNLRWILSDEEPAGERLRAAALVRLASVFKVDGRPRMAERRLQRAIDEAGSAPFLEQMFALLDSVRSADETDTVARYTRWSLDASSPERRAYALFYLAKYQLATGHPDNAIRLFDEFRSTAPKNPRHGEALRLLMGINGAQHNDERVLELAREWQKRYGAGGQDTVDFLTGMISFSRHDLTEAAAQFLKSAEAAADAVLKRRALFNMGLAALAGTSTDSYSRAVALLQDGPLDAESKDGEASATALEFERAVHLAASRDNGAEDALRSFVKKHGDHPRCVEAHIALAEVCLLDVPPRTKAAQTALDAAAAIKDAPEELRERLDYTTVWLHEAEENLHAVATSGAAFLERWPRSAHSDDVRMRVAQTYYRLEEFPKARAAFEALPEAHPESPYAEIALFFAGRSAMATLNKNDLEKAIDLFGEVVDRKGLLAIEARRQMARIKRLQGNEVDALGEIEAMLSSKEPPKGDDALALRIEKGELHLLLARKEPKHLDDALAVFRDIASGQADPRYWRLRAGVLLAQTQQRLGHTNEALEACHDAIELCAVREPATQMSTSEQTWFFRAGFLALEILDAQKQWEAAALLADRLAKSSGARAQEAKERANRLRLEHFIWDK